MNCIKCGNEVTYTLTGTSLTPFCVCCRVYLVEFEPPIYRGIDHYDYIEVEPSNLNVKESN